MKDVYLNKFAAFFPNEPVTNDEIEDRLGRINGMDSINRGLILRSNQIKTRYYALDKEGNPTHTNAEMAAIAIRKLFDDKIKYQDIDLLVAGTSSADVIQPAHALMVHGELGGHPMEVMSGEGTCNAGMISMKYAWMSMLAGFSKNAVCAASETLGSWMLSRNYEKEIDMRKEIESNPYVAFDKEFLRWMLSDAAGATLMQDKPNENGISLKIEWIEILSYANELDTCMYAGGEKDESGKMIGWKAMSTDEQEISTVFSLKQDARLLQKHMVSKGIDFLQDLHKKYNFSNNDFEYFLPHISSMFFKRQIYNGLVEREIPIDYDKWQLNLTTKGNVGAAAPFILMEELFHSGKLKKGDRILMMIPESARFSFTYMYLTTV